MEDKPNILFIVVDCLRGDRCFGDDRNCKTPTIDFLKRSGTSFTKAISTSTSTGPCFAAIMTGQYPFNHGLRETSKLKLNQNSKTIAEILKRYGYHTYGEVSGPLSENLGINKGFIEYNYRPVLDNVYSKWYEKLLNRIDSNHFKEPWFLFIHFWDIHDPRRVTLRFDRAKYGKNLYERSLSNFDYKLKDLIDKVNIDNDVIIFTGDHGEKLAENFLEELYNRSKHIYYPLIKWKNEEIAKTISNTMGKIKGTNKSKDFGKTHGWGLYNYLLEIPLIFVGKKYFPEKEISRVVRHIDILPTLLDIVCINEEKYACDIDGKSLFSIIDDKETSERIAYSEIFLGHKLEEYNFLISIREEQYQLLYYPFKPDFTVELYDVNEDGMENIQVENMKISDYLIKKAQEINPEILSKKMRLGNRLSKIEEQEIKERLTRLGYLD